MSYFVGNMYSDTLKQDTQVHVILPQDGRRYIWNENPKTLVLLHGLSDNASTWVRKTAIERYAERYNLAVIIPEVQRSWYLDMVSGINAYSYITKELPQLIAKLFHLSNEREDMMIAGLSMGGYGALRCAIEASDVYAYCGAFSGGYDLNEVINLSKVPDSDNLLEGIDEEMVAVVGNDSHVPEEVLIPNVIKASVERNAKQPKVYMVCGTEDFLYGQSQAVKKVCEENLKDFTYEEWHGIHEWDVWDTAIEKMLKLFLGEGRKDS
ncbi:esterase family protein [Lachnospiraceae bacterium ZAX-1]